jgi:hypothetical protein
MANDFILTSCWAGSGALPPLSFLAVDSKPDAL